MATVSHNPKVIDSDASIDLLDQVNAALRTTLELLAPIPGNTGARDPATLELLSPLSGLSMVDRDGLASMMGLLSRLQRDGDNDAGIALAFSAVGDLLCPEPGLSCCDRASLFALFDCFVTLQETLAERLRAECITHVRPAARGSRNAIPVTDLFARDASRAH